MSANRGVFGLPPGRHPDRWLDQLAPIPHSSDTSLWLAPSPWFSGRQANDLGVTYHCTPLWFPIGGTITALALNVTTSFASNSTGVAIYTALRYSSGLVTGYPDRLVVFGGTSAVTSTGLKEFTGLSSRITPGIYIAVSYVPGGSALGAYKYGSPLGAWGSTSANAYNNDSNCLAFNSGVSPLATNWTMGAPQRWPRFKAVDIADSTGSTRTPVWIGVQFSADEVLLT